MTNPAITRQQPTGERFAPREFRWTVELLYQMADQWVFGEPLLIELVRGRVIQHCGQTPLHAYTTEHITRLLRKVLEPSLMVWEHKPLNISEDTEPNTDILAVTGNFNDYREKHPGPKEVALLIEVADVSLAYDIGDKALLYAQAGITDYWVVLVDSAAIVQYREPTPEGYQSVTRFGGADTISLLAKPEAAWTVEALLGIKE